MIAVAFGTHAFIKRLVSAGMPEDQAEFLAEEQSKIIESQLTRNYDFILVDNYFKIYLTKFEKSLKFYIAVFDTAIKYDLWLAKRDLKI